MNIPSQSINAWIMLGENDPSNTTYDSPNSAYQILIANNVYRMMDFLCICFWDTVPTGTEGYCTLQMDPSNQPDLLKMIRDARNQNPGLKIMATTGWGTGKSSGAYLLSRIFDATKQGKTNQQCAAAFAANLVNVLKGYNMNGLDIDWERDTCNNITSDQYTALFTAIRAAFDPEGFYLFQSPSEYGTAQVKDTTNSCFNLINLQTYGYTWNIQDVFCNEGINPALYAYGTLFEGENNVYQYSDDEHNAVNVYQTMKAGFNCSNTPYVYNGATSWRMNSGNYYYEQSQQILLYGLSKNISSISFDDTVIIGNNNNPPISQLIVRSGEVVDAIQLFNTDANGNVYCLLQHGGNGGGMSNNGQPIAITASNPIVQVDGYTGIWFGWNVVAQITFILRDGTRYGPYGSMRNVSGQQSFTLAAPGGKSIVAFKGTMIRVPEYPNTVNYVLGSLDASYG